MRVEYFIYSIFLILCSSSFAQQLEFDGSQLEGPLSFGESLVGEPVLTYYGAEDTTPVLQQNEPLAGNQDFTTYELGTPVFAFNESASRGFTFISDKTAIGAHSDDPDWFNAALNQPSSVSSFANAARDVRLDSSIREITPLNTNKEGELQGGEWLEGYSASGQKGKNTGVLGSSGNSGNNTGSYWTEGQSTGTTGSTGNAIAVGSAGASRNNAGQTSSKTKQYLAEGNRLYDEGSYASALEYYEKAIALNPNLAELWYNKGNTLYKLGEFEEAVTAYDKAITLNRNLAKAWTNKGYALEKLGRTNDAEAAFAKARELGSG